MAKKGPRPRPILERLWAHTVVEDRGHGTACWIWQGSTSKGYGRISMASPEGRRLVRQTHRVAYELIVAPVADDLDLDHRCRVRECWRPDHLEPVTRRENVLRGASPVAAQAQQTHCVHGHEFTPENTGRNRGKRVCRACRRTWAREAYERQRRKAA